MNRCKTLFMSWIFPWVPKRLLSRLTGVVMRLPLGPLSGLLIPRFAAVFNIKIAEAERAPGTYRSFDDFFTRRLRAGLRPIRADLIHPVDGRLTENGTVTSGQLVQAKGWTYSLGEFLGDEKLAAQYAGGSFVTYYLCPADYHRVHAPFSGELLSSRHIPGLLWPVNEWSVNSIERLFNLNERVVLNFMSPRGRWSLVMVGATNVGHMTMTIDPSIVTNQWRWSEPTSRLYSPPLTVKVGDELGMFHLGSTVICIYEWTVPSQSPQAVLLGQSF
jgi:phosphatidylserine decarboxylase